MSLLDDAPRPPDAAGVVGGFGARLAVLAATRPGLDTITAAVAIDPKTVDAGTRVDQLIVIERAERWLAAHKQVVLAAIESGTATTGDAVAELEDDACRGLVGQALALHPVTASGRLDTAETLVTLLPRTLSTLRAGEISVTQATLIASFVFELPAERRAELLPRYEATVLAKAPGQTAGETKRYAEKTVMQLAPKEADERHEQAYSKRRIDAWATEDAMAEIRATLGADGMITTMTALNGLADAVLAGNPTEERSLAQLRADLFVDVFDAILHGTEMPSPYFPPEPDEPSPTPPATPIPSSGDAEPTRTPRPRRRPRGKRRTTITATAPNDTAHGTGLQPGHLDGYGPVPASVIRRLTHGARFHTGILDPATGILIGLGPDTQTLITASTDYGTTIYRPPTWLDHYIRTRDRTCTFPGCSRRAALCDIDHITPHPDGPTSAPNLHCLCRRHHRLKTQHLWTVRRLPDHRLEWTSPTGHTYTWQPPPLC